MRKESLSALHLSRLWCRCSRVGVPRTWQLFDFDRSPRSRKLCREQFGVRFFQKTEMGIACAPF